MDAGQSCDGIHPHGCPCLLCADDRRAMRARGIWPIAARDWRGVLLVRTWLAGAAGLAALGRCGFVCVYCGLPDAPILADLDGRQQMFAHDDAPGRDVGDAECVGNLGKREQHVVLLHGANGTPTCKKSTR